MNSVSEIKPSCPLSMEANAICHALAPPGFPTEPSCPQALDQTDSNWPQRTCPPGYSCLTASHALWHAQLPPPGAGAPAAAGAGAGAAPLAQWPPYLSCKPEAHSRI